jgi:hypothetical protein
MPPWFGPARVVLAYTPAMATHTPVSPSPMLTHLDDALAAVLPEDQLAELAARDAAVARTTDAVDRQRCLHCARWAVRLVDSRPGGPVSHAVDRLRTVVHELRDAYRGARLGAIVAGADPATDVELGWVDDAVAAAVATAEQVGWADVPWQELIDDLIAMEPELRAPAPAEAPRTGQSQP